MNEGNNVLTFQMKIFKNIRTNLILFSYNQKINFFKKNYKAILYEIKKEKFFIVVETIFWDF